MKKILIAAMALACSAAFADVQGQKTEVVTSSGAVSSSNGGVQGQQQGIKDSGNSSAQAGVQSAGNSAVTVGCLVNCASTDQGTKDLADSAVLAATINAQAARDVADKNGETARAVAGTTQTIKNTPGIALGQLTSSNDTCMGSVSVGGSGPGFSLGIGTTYTDDNCKMLKNSRELWNMGMKAAAMALMCKNADNREALELTGFECPQTAAAKKTAAAEQAAQAKVAAAQPANVTGQGSAEKLASAYNGSDPIVRARLGMTPTASSK